MFVAHTHFSSSPFCVYSSAVGLSCGKTSISPVSVIPRFPTTNKEKSFFQPLTEAAISEGNVSLFSVIHWLKYSISLLASDSLKCIPSLSSFVTFDLIIKSVVLFQRIFSLCLLSLILSLYRISPLSILSPIAVITQGVVEICISCFSGSPYLENLYSVL